LLWLVFYVQVYFGGLQRKIEKKNGVDVAMRQDFFNGWFAVSRHQK